MTDKQMEKAVAHTRKAVALAKARAALASYYAGSVSTSVKSTPAKKIKVK